MPNRNGLQSLLQSVGDAVIDPTLTTCPLKSLLIGGELVFARLEFQKSRSTVRQNKQQIRRAWQNAHGLKARSLNSRSSAAVGNVHEKRRWTHQAQNADELDLQSFFGIASLWAI